MGKANTVSDIPRISEAVFLCLEFAIMSAFETTLKGTKNMGGAIIAGAVACLFVNHPILTTITLASLMSGLKSKD